jgi:hypothetical protein
MIFLLAFSYNGRSQGCVKKLVMQTKTPSNSDSIIRRCLICFCPSNAPYVGDFVLLMAFAPITGRDWFYHSAFLPML